MCAAVQQIIGKQFPTQSHYIGISWIPYHFILRRLARLCSLHTRRLWNLFCNLRNWLPNPLKQLNVFNVISMLLHHEYPCWLPWVSHVIFWFRDNESHNLLPICSIHYLSRIQRSKLCNIQHECEMHRFFEIVQDQHLPKGNRWFQRSCQVWRFERLFHSDRHIHKNTRAVNEIDHTLHDFFFLCSSQQAKLMVGVLFMSQNCISMRNRLALLRETMIYAPKHGGFIKSRVRTTLARVVWFVYWRVSH